MRLPLMILLVCSLYGAGKAAVALAGDCVHCGLTLNPGIYQYANQCAIFECLPGGKSGRFESCGVTQVTNGCKAVTAFPKARYPRCCIKKEVCPK